MYDLYKSKINLRLTYRSDINFDKLITKLSSRISYV